LAKIWQVNFVKNSLNKTIGAVDKLGRWLTAFCAVLLAIMMLANVIDIVGTKWFKWGLPGVLDISEEMMVIMTMLPVGYLLLERGHINLSLIEDRQSPAGRYVFQIVKGVAGILVGAFLTWRTFAQFQYVFQSNLGKVGLPQFPVWPSNLIVAISWALFTLIWFLILIRTFTMGKEKIARGQGTDSPL
jgi:TRAP-type C4-dicarboxylate transport system permease small subunit